MKKMMLTLVMLSIGVFATNVSQAQGMSYKDAKIVWHGHSNNSQTFARGWWQSTPKWGSYTSWWYYSPSISGPATVELLSVDSRTRYFIPLGTLLIPQAYTYTALPIQTATVDSKDIAETVFSLNETLSETWFTGGEQPYLYVYGRTKRAWFLRVTLPSQWPGGSGPAPAPGNAGGLSALEVVVYNPNMMIDGNFPLCIPAGVKVIDFDIDFSNFTSTVLKTWTGSASYPLTDYYNTWFTPHDPTWTSVYP